jgi:methylated-DNA-[protein]-cysteine S-methyltransferase
MPCCGFGQGFIGHRYEAFLHYVSYSKQSPIDEGQEHNMPMISSIHPTSVQCVQRFSSALGDIWLSACDAGLSGLWFADQAHLPDFSQACHWQQTEHRYMQHAMAQLERYFAGQLGSAGLSFDADLPLHFAYGTPFQRSVWQALLRIPLGQYSSYGELAASLRKPQASRAVGAAVGRNPIGIFVPCHRVLGKDGSLTGYAGGLERKVALLRLEGVLMS